jgi:hypothetical protein
VRDDFIEVRVGVGTNEITPGTYTLYPNPVTGNRLYFKTSSRPLSYRFTTLSGKLIKEGDLSGMEEYFDVSFLNNGIYLLVITEKNGMGVCKVVVWR